MNWTTQRKMNGREYRCILFSRISIWKTVKIMNLKMEGLEIIHNLFFTAHFSMREISGSELKSNLLYSDKRNSGWMNKPNKRILECKINKKIHFSLKEEMQLDYFKLSFVCFLWTIKCDFFLLMNLFSNDWNSMITEVLRLEVNISVLLVLYWIFPPKIHCSFSISHIMVFANFMVFEKNAHPLPPTEPWKSFRYFLVIIKTFTVFWLVSSSDTLFVNVRH